MSAVAEQIQTEIPAPLVFTDSAAAKVADLIAEVNRYSTVQLRLADRSLDDLRVSGVFHVGDQASLLEALKVGWSISAKQASEREIELSRN